MFGGIAVAGNLLCIAQAAARGEVFLVDLEDLRLASRWTYSAEDGGFSDAGGVAFDASYNIYVADTRNDVVRRFTPFGRSTGCIGRPPGRGPGAAERDRKGLLDRPRAVAVWQDTVFVACGERWLRRGVQRFTRDGAVLDPLRAFGESDARFGAPRGLSASARGVFVADTLHGVVQRFRPHGVYLDSISTAVSSEEVSRPIAVVPLSNDEILVMDDGDAASLRRFTIEGRLLDADVAIPERLEDPVALASDDRDRVYVLDRGGHRVQRLGRDLRSDGVVFDLDEIALD